MNKLLKEAMDSLALVGIYSKDADTVSEYNAEIQRLTRKAEQLRKAGQGKSAMEVEKQIEKLGKELRDVTDNDATENGAIKEFGQSKETEVMPLEKKPVLAQDASIEKIPANYRPEFPKEGYLVRYSNGMKAKWFATKEEAEAFMAQMKKEGKDSAPDQKELQRLNNLHVYEKLKEIVEENMKRYKPDHPEYKRLAGLSKKYEDEIKRYSKDEEPVYTLGKESKEDIQKQIDKLKRVEYVDSQSEHYKPNQKNLNKIKKLEEKLKKMSKDEKTYQNGEHVKVKNHGTGEEIDLKVLKDNKDGTLEVKAPTGAVITIKKTWIVDSEPTTLDECMKVLKLSGFLTDAEENWITMKGTHIKIEEGQSKGEAAKNFINKKKGGEAAPAKPKAKETTKSKLTPSQKKVAKYLEEECELSSPEDIKKSGYTPEKSYVKSYNNALNYPVGSKVLVDGKQEVIEDYLSDDDGEVVYAELKSGDMVDASELKPIGSKQEGTNGQQTYKPGDVLRSPSDGKKIGKVEKEFKNLHGKDIIAVTKKKWGEDVTIYVPKDNVDVLASYKPEKPTPEEKKEFKKDIKKLAEIQNRIGDGKELVDAELAMKEKYVGLDLPTHSNSLGIVDWEEVLKNEIKE